jgi:SM-20-related protein
MEQMPAMPPLNIESIAEQLLRVGFIVLHKPLPGSLSQDLLVRCQADGLGRFAAAQMGRGRAKKQIKEMRGDVISWLDSENATDQAYLAWMEQLRVGLNGLLFLGLFDFESHYAIYEAGAGYAKHSDVLHGEKNRVLSTVYYLNEDWQASDGGELVIFDPAGDTVIATLKPEFGRMIIFLSESCPHEVLKAHRQRRSITGWFRVRATG